VTRAIIKNEAHAAARSRAAAMLLVATALFSASLPAFHQQVFGTRMSDIPAHFLIERSGVYSVYSILYLLVRGLLLIGADEEALGWVAIILLSTCVALKGALTFSMLCEDAKSPTLPACIAIVLAFVMPIINWWNYQSVYLGQIAPTIWHNATTILAMPAVILLFRASLRCLKEPNFKNAAVMAGFGVLSTLIKPSYTIAWLPIFVPWFCLRAHFGSGMSLRHLARQVAILVGPIAIVLFVQGLLVARLVNSSVIVAPFGVWSLYSPHPVFSSLLSLAFPLAVAILYRDCLVRDAGLQFAWPVFGVALLQFALLAEGGDRFGAGNFFWGAYMALYTLFLSSASVLMRQPKSRRALPALVVLALHFASGLYFYWRIVGGLGYM
jgi:hypothetical protein